MVGRSALEREVVEFLDGDDALVRGVPHAVHGTERALAEDAALLVRVEHEHAAHDTAIGNKVRRVIRCLDSTRHSHSSGRQSAQL